MRSDIFEKPYVQGWACYSSSLQQMSPQCHFSRLHSEKRQKSIIQCLYCRYIYIIFFLYNWIYWSYKMAKKKHTIQSINKTYRTYDCHLLGVTKKYIPWINNLQKYVQYAQQEFNGSANKALDPCTGNKVSRCRVSQLSPTYNVKR